MLVVGAGPMGRLHARKIAARSARDGRIELAAVVDRNLDRAQAIASELAALAASTTEDDRLGVDAAIVAVPAHSHAAVSMPLLEAGIDLLIEKPLALDSKQARALRAEADRRHCVLQVGQLEWYNPAWRAAWDQAGAPREIEIERCNPFTGRGLDLDVVRDLMIHDLDWVQRRFGGPPIEVAASGRCVESDRIDEAEADLEFAGGCHVRLRASRVAKHTRRSARIAGRGGEFVADLVEHRVRCASDAATLVEVAAVDPLDAQLVDFLGAIRDRSVPETGAAEGIAALETAERVLAAMGADELGRPQ